VSFWLVSPETDSVEEAAMPAPWKVVLIGCVRAKVNPNTSPAANCMLKKEGSPALCYPAAMTEFLILVVGFLRAIVQTACR